MPRAAAKPKPEGRDIRLRAAQGFRLVNLTPEDFTWLRAAAGGNCQIDKIFAKPFDRLRRMGLVRHKVKYGDADQWPVMVAVLTPDGEQALAQAP
jgi:hypothetical protein